MKISHLEILVEEPSMEAFLVALLPRVPRDELSFRVYPYQGKNDLLRKLHQRLLGYVNWLPSDWRIVVLLDRDDESCMELKEQMEDAAKESKTCDSDRRRFGRLAGREQNRH
jgi:hypothetical protein